MDLLFAKLRYSFPQKAKLIGVVNMHAAVLNAVRDTESSELPRDNEVMKFEMFPPGHDATRIIPNAIIREMLSPKAMIRTSVKAGRRTIWQTMPVIMDLGFLSMSTNVAGLIPSATPNITNANTILSRVEPPFIETLMASMLALNSGLIMKVFRLLSGQIYD